MTARKIWWFIISCLSSAGFAQAQESSVSPCPLATEQFIEGQVVEAYQRAQQCLWAAQQAEGLNSVTYAELLGLLTRISASAGDYALALAWVRREVTVRAQFAESSPALYGQALQNQGVLYLRVDSLVAARRSLVEAERVFRTIKAPLPLRLPYLLAKVHHRTGDFNRADSLYQRVISEAHAVDSLTLRDRATYYRSLLPDSSFISSGDGVYQQLIAQFQRTGDTLSLAYADACYRLGNTLVANDAWKAALPWYRRALTVYETGVPVDSTAYAGVLHNLGVMQVTQSRNQEAVQLLTQAHRIRQQHYTARDGAWWTSLDNLATALDQNDSTNQAIALYEALERADSTRLYPWQYAVALSNRATIYQRQQQYALAETYYARATRHLKNHPPTTPEQQLHQAAIFCNVARNQQQLARFDSAIYYFKRGTEIIRRVKGTNSDAYVAAVNGMAGLYHDLGYFVESDIFYQEALKLQKELSGEFTNAYANLLNNYALVCQEQGNLTQATELLNQSLKIKKALLGADHPDYGLALANVGLVHLEAARYQQARPLLELALTATVAQHSEAHPATISAYINLARLAMAQGNYPQAEQWLKKATTIAQTHFDPTHPEYARSRIELANFYLALGNYAAAKPLLLAGQRILRDKYGATHPEYATATQNLAGLYEAVGQVDSAEALYQEALRTDRQTLGKQHPSYATALNNLAALYQNQGIYAKAKPLLEESLDISRTLYGEEHPRHITTLLNLGLLHQSVGEYEQAQSCIERVVAVRRKTLNDKHPDYAFSRYAQAVLYHTLGDSERAEPIFREVMQRYTQQLREYFPALSEKEKSAFFLRVEPVLHAVQDFIIDRVLNQAQASDETSQALLGDFYNLQLLTKAILLNSSSQINATITNSNDDELMARYQQWISAKETLARLYALPPTEWKQQQGRVSSLEDRANALEKELSLRSAQFANDLRDRRFTWRDIRQQLQPDEAAIEIIRVEKEEDSLVFYVALAITPGADGPSIKLLPNGKAMETKNFNYYKNAIDFRVSDALSYDLYWKPIRSLLSPQTTTIYVAPDGVYHKISLNSLLNPRTDRFIIEETTVHMLSSTRELLRPPSVVNHRNAYLFGDPTYQLEAPFVDALAKIPNDPTSRTNPELMTSFNGFVSPPEADNLRTLPGTEQEVDHLAQLLRHHQWKTHTYLKTEATEEVVKHLNAPRLLHIATHGYFMSDLQPNGSSSAFGLHVPNARANPLLRSGLMLAGAATSLQRQRLQQVGSWEQEDGILTAYEAKNLDLSGTELVVLSACETGLGEIRNGEGVYGLQRAFLVAGAEGVLMSLWKVDDQSTAELMQLFYERWLGGEDKASALQEAQRAMMRTHRDPYYWGAFVLIGR